MGKGSEEHLFENQQPVNNEEFYDRKVIINILDKKQFNLFILLMNLLSRAFLEKELNSKNYGSVSRELFSHLYNMTSGNKMMLIQIMADVIEEFVYFANFKELKGYDYELVALCLYNTYCQFIDNGATDDFYPLTYNQLLDEFEEFLRNLE